MSRWTDQWKKFVRETSYVHDLKEEKISNDQFWRSYGIYDKILMHSGYPGEILSKISSFISPKATFLDIGAGTGAFAIPLSRKTTQTIAVDPSAYQLQILSEKARQEGLTNIITNSFDLILFQRDYSLPIDLLFKVYRSSKKGRDELLGHLSREGRLQERADGKWAAFSAKDALLYRIR